MKSLFNKRTWFTFALLVLCTACTQTQTAGTTWDNGYNAVPLPITNQVSAMGPSAGIF